MLVSSADNATSGRCLLIDEGISIEEIPAQFFGSSDDCELLLRDFYNNFIASFSCCQL